MQIVCDGKGHNMKRTGVFRLTLLMVVACYQIAVAQPGGSMQRIGVLTPNHAINFADNLDALRQGLRDLGYIEGKNFAIEFRHGDGQLNRLAELIADLVRIKVSVIVISSSPAALAAREITKDIPIVFSVTGDAVAAGLVASLARPGGNLTGVTTGASELYGKRLELLKEAVPRLSHAGLMFNPETRKWRQKKRGRRPSARYSDATA